MLALPPGYASAIFPPAGIAITAVLVGGKRFIPAIFLGSLFLNIWVGYTATHQIGLFGIEVAALIAIASALQAQLGGYWLRAIIDYPTRLDSPKDAVYFFASAPFICVVSASISVIGLFLFGLIDEPGIVSSWASWWIGDTLGLIVMLPLTLIAIGSPRAIWRKRIATVALPMAIVFALLILIFIVSNRWERRESLTEFNALSNKVAEQLQVRFDTQESVLSQTSGLFTFRNFDFVTREDFHNFVQEILKGFPTIYAIEWAPKVSDYERPGFIELQRKDIPNFEIREVSPSKDFVTADKRPFYFPIAYSEPLSPDLMPILGFDLASIPDRKATIETALRDNVAVATHPIKLVLNHGKEPGLLLLYPVNGKMQDGIVLTALKVSDFIGDLFAPMRRSLDVRLIDVEQNEPLYDNFSNPDEEVLFTRGFVFGTRHYRLETTPTKFYYQQHKSWESWSLLAIGLFGTGLMGALLLIGTGYTSRVEGLVEEKTDELKESLSRFEEITSTLGEGIYVMDLDGFITFTNPVAQRLLGYMEEEMLGKNGHMLFHNRKIDQTPFPEDECEMKNVMLTGIPYKSRDEVFWRKNGSHIYVRVTSEPMIREGKIVGAVVVFDDISDRIRMEQALRESEQSFREIIEFAPIGMCIVSLKGQFINVNQALCRMLGFESEELTAMTIRDITHPDDLDISGEHVQRLLNGEFKSYQLEKRYIRKDRQIVWAQLSVSLFRSEDQAPAYMIAQIEDVTERRLRQEQIMEQAFIDPLTNLPNRRMLLNRLHQALSQAERYYRPMAVLFVDLDHFKQINDTMGHDAGDIVLREVSQRLAVCVRTHDTVSRQGGDEFVIILTEITKVEDASVVAEKILSILKSPIRIGETHATIGSSIGIATRSGGDKLSVDEIMKRADTAMYMAKTAGRNGYKVYPTDE